MCCFADTFEAHKRLPTVSSLKTLQKVSGEVDNVGGVPNDVQVDNVGEGDVFGTGLKNEVGEYNCFLNVIIQVRLYDELVVKCMILLHLHFI